MIYQVYPRSFADGNGDGIGDLPGLIDKLDYVNDGTEHSLGVDAIWLSPIHPSPGFDVGYDVSDYDAIDPVFGTLDDFDRLVAEAHRRGIRILLDLVMNHTSSAHRWFEESRRDPGGPYGDWYLWRDGTRDRFGRRRPPNNWASFFGGSAWTWDEVRGQFYMHTFLPEQPDVNWRNPKVREAMLTMVRGWLDRGVDGFRLDVFNAFFKDAELLSNPRRLLGRRPYDRQVHLYDKDRPELAGFLAEFRALVDSYPGRMTVGELFSGDPALAPKLSTPRHLVFDFELIRQRWNARGFADASRKHEERFGPDGWPTIVLSNHDQSRQASRLAPNARCRHQRRDRPRGGGPEPDPARDAIPLLRGGDRGARRARAVARDHRSTGQARRPPGPAARPVVEPGPGPVPDAVGRRAERRVLGWGARGSGWRRTSRRGTSRSRIGIRRRSSPPIAASSGSGAGTRRSRSGRYRELGRRPA